MKWTQRTLVTIFYSRTHTKRDTLIIIVPSIETRTYTTAGSCIKTALPQTLRPCKLGRCKLGTNFPLRPSPVYNRFFVAFFFACYCTLITDDLIVAHPCIKSLTFKFESEIETCAKVCKVDKCHWKYSGLRNWECEWWLRLASDHVMSRHVP